MGCVALAAPIPQAPARLYSNEQGPACSRDRRGCLRLEHSTGKGAAVGGGIRAFSCPHYPPLQYQYSSSRAEGAVFLHAVHMMERD